jgi:glycogen operon protein
MTGAGVTRSGCARQPLPLGATPSPGGTNFAVPGVAEGMALCLFDDAGAEIRVALPEYGAGSGTASSRAPAPARPHATVPPAPGPGPGALHPAKLLLDPWLATTGPVRFGPEVLGHDLPIRPAKPADSAAHVPGAWSSTRPSTGQAAPHRGTAMPTPSCTRCT